MKVYVAARGENERGVGVLGVYRNVDDAIDRAFKEERHGGPWTLDPNATFIWWSGSDFIEVREYEVQ